jgi:hypothetical protein
MGKKFYNIGSRTYPEPPFVLDLSAKVEIQLGNQEPIASSGQTLK